MLTARLGSEVIRAGANLKGKDFVYRCRDLHCECPEMELVIGRGLRVPHFRHKRKGNCSCSDGETEWHREWKSHFEQVERDMGLDPVTREHNRADAVVGQDFVIEFQHSPISLEEQQNRERFYGGKGGMVWVVYAEKKRLLKRLDEAKNNHAFLRINEQPFTGKYFEAWTYSEIFPKGWLDRPVGVIFDYGEAHDLIYLLPMRGEKKLICRFYTREALIEALKKEPGQFMLSVGQIRADYILQEKKKREAEELARRMAERERQKKFEELRRKVSEATAQAQKIQMSQPPGKWYFHPVVGTDLYVDANGQTYNVVNNMPIPSVLPGVTPRPRAFRRFRL